MRCTALLILLASIVAGPVGGTTYTLMPDGTGDFPTIQTALDAVLDGDIIELTDGTYSGAGNRDVEFLGKAVTVRSQTGDPEACIIDCGGTASEFHRGFIFSSGESSATILDGVTVTNGFSDLGGGLYCVLWSSPTISNCRIIANTISESGIGGGGIACIHGSSPLLIQCIIADNAAPTGVGGGVLDSYGTPTFAECTFSGNWSDEAGGGIFCSGSVGYLENCTLAGNAAQAGGGLYCEAQAVIELTNTIVAFGNEGEAAACDSLSTIVLSCSDLYGNIGGDWVGCVEDQLGLAGNISEDPLFCGLESGDFHLQDDSPCGPFSPPNPECDLIGAWPVGCETGTGVTPGMHTSVLDWQLGLSPNPCTGLTHITCSVPSPLVGATPNLGIYDAAGRLMRTFSLDTQVVGTVSLRWDGTDETGAAVPSGRYYCRLRGINDSPGIALILVR
ncbi:FlgD immunoglobulin-like domain containing protein [Candidatus Eisenbacteria bacterium]|uniref:FlgD immunoglobulin-like domain containing protein n=1 Tax=Eiseniibacteriota bacterium TaxID=2212470 RepID=A0ABV6YMF8_UNCEI